MSRNMKTAATKEEAKPALVPKLRFPEFRGNGEWKERPLGDFLSESRLSGSKGNVAKKITVKLWGNGVFEKNDAIQGSINTQYFRRKAGQFIYSKLDFLNQAFGIIPPNLDNFESTVDLPCFDFAEGLNPVFLLEYVKRRDFYERLGETADGSRKARRIHAETFLSFPIALPTPAEQQKIAECLSSVDELMAAQARRVAALKTHKKGLMQQLFPREGETQPRLRFPEFQNAGKWEEKVGGELFTNRKEKGEDGLPIYSVTVNGGMVPRASFDRNFYDIEDPAGNRNVHRGDIAYNMMRMWQGAQGVAPEDCLVSPAYVVLKPRAGVCSDFFAYLFKLPQSLRLLAITSRGLTKDRLRLYFDDFAKMPLCVPSSIAEQQRIADCLSSLDALITAETEKLETLKTHKKGLMQQLFPSPGEVEG